MTKVPPTARRRRLCAEPLESRALLEGGGVSAYLSLSFVADGVVVGQQQSDLLATFDQVAPRADWQRAVEQGFQQWAAHTNADIVRVGDSGDPLGTSGRQARNPRFGDVRVAAAPLDGSVWALSFPLDHLAWGTWAGDIVFNSALSWDSLDQIASVALHEAGHVFGLEHSPDPHSAMHIHGASQVLEPSPQDITNLQFLYGSRGLDDFEVEGDNDDFERATLLSDELGSADRALAYGDIARVGDVDLFELEVDEELEGPLVVRVDASGLSLLSPVVQLYSEDRELLAEASATAGVAELTYEAAGEEAEWFVQVTADAQGAAQVGRFSVLVTTEAADLDDEDYGDFSAGDWFGLPYDAFDRFLSRDDDDDELVFDDEDEDLEMGPVTELVPVSMNAGQLWYEQRGSIASPQDADLYALETPEEWGSALSVLTVSLRSLEVGGLIPTVEIRDADGQRIATEVLANGGGEQVIQTTALAEDETVYLSVQPRDPGGAFARGNYQLAARFGGQRVTLETFAFGELSADSPVQASRLHVATPQLFHLLLETTSATQAGGALTVDIFDDQNQRVYTLLVPSGAAGSGAHPLLKPGSYTIRFGMVSTPPAGELVTFRLGGLATSNPLGVVPVDPTTEPAFGCQEASGRFCYPGGVNTENPFFWDVFIQNYLDQKWQQDPPSSFDADVQWWDWYLAGGLDQPPDTVPVASEDGFRVFGARLDVRAERGVLSNDAVSPGTPVVARLVSSPLHGSLELAADGSFVYRPDEGYFGQDWFVYQAFDFHVPSSPTTVQLQVSRPGDANDDGQVSFADFLVLSNRFGAAAATWEDGDFDGDGQVAFADFLLLSRYFG